MRQRKFVHLGSYYDATATTPERDYGPFGGAVYEDYQFTDSQRAVALSRLRREVRNNPYLAGLVGKYPEAIGQSNLRSRTSSAAYNDAKELFWYRWAKSVTTAGDSLRSLEKMIQHELLVAGEVFLVLMRFGKVQVVPSEFCGSPGVLSGSEINGIQYNDYGRPLRYRFGSLNAFGAVEFGEANSTVVDARHVIHIYHKDRVLMGRGLPWLLPAVQTARDLYEITRAKSKQIKDVTSLIGYLSKTQDSQGLQGLITPGFDPQAGDVAEAADENDAADPQTDAPKKLELKPGMFPELDPGEKIELLSGQYQATDYKELIMLMLHAISSPVGLPVELWFSGLGDVNYSGFKGLGTQWNARRKDICQFLEDKFLDRLHFWRVSKAALEGDLPANPDGDDDLIDWAWRRTAVLDDEKHAKSVQTRIASGERCVSDFWEEDGFYAEEVLEQRRQLYLTAAKKAGMSTEEVPIEFLLMNQLPGAKATGASNKEEEREEEVVA